MLHDKIAVPVEEVLQEYGIDNQVLSMPSLQIQLSKL